MKKILFIVIIILLAGCSDNDDFQLKSINDITINGITNSYIANVNSPLKIEPNITADKDEVLSYVWYTYSNISTKTDTLSTEKNLDVVINPSKLPPGKYTLTFKVTDTETGVYTATRTQLEIRTLLSKGTIFLCKTGDVTDITFMTVNGDDIELYDNVYSMSNNNENLSSKSTKVFFIDPNKYAPFLKQVLVFCDDELGGVVLDPQTFVKNKSVRNAFDTNISDPILKPHTYFRETVDYILMNSLLYKRSINMQSINWEPPLVVSGGNTTYRLSNSIFSVNGAPTVYDYQNGRLLQHNPYNMGRLVLLPSTGMDTRYFDFNNFGPNLDMITAGRLSEPGGYWMLMKNTTDGKYFIYKFRTAGAKLNQYVSVAKVELTPEIAPNISEAKVFSNAEEYSDLLLYATDNVVYSLLINNINDGQSTLAENAQIDLTSEGKSITNIKFTPIINSYINNEGKEVEDITYQARISAQDVNKKGGVMFYEINTLGGINSKKIFELFGFCDEVIDIEEKYS